MLIHACKQVKNNRRVTNESNGLTTQYERNQIVDANAT